MKLKHPCITSPFFKLIDTYEVDIHFELGDDGEHFSLRIELFQSLEDKSVFRYRAWRDELFRIQSTFPRDSRNVPRHEPSDELILTAFSQVNFGSSVELNANTVQDALNEAIDHLGDMLENVSGLAVSRKPNGRVK
ncbi:MAG TPA: hypothetical protein PKL48_05910 [Thermodesulfobacteriota bacterium]|nr:hypothetical protein [Deltaproteobacteria bacterium]HNU71232.1 hypothetical protein [Thermodesulfobacteriota bacterium]